LGEELTTDECKDLVFRMRGSKSAKDTFYKDDPRQSSPEVGRKTFPQLLAALSP
jgi:hypothetical protein